MTRYLKMAMLAGLVVSMAACEKENKRSVKPAAAPEEDAGLGWKSHKWSRYEVVRVFPHDNTAYTQGFLLSNGHWIESTGGYGRSVLRRVDVATGKVEAEKKLDRNLFGEGVAELDGKLYQLTWRSQKGLVYDAKTLEKTGEFSYHGEGWGLTTDGKALIMSDGSDRLRFLDPVTFRVMRVVPVSYGGKPVRMLNELEFVEGEIFANVWHTEQIVRINPANGRVVGVIDLTGIYPQAGRRNPEFVLNGIAYDPKGKQIYVTGKCWPKIYQIRLVKAR